MKKLCAVFAIIFIILVFMTGCRHNITVDYTKEYKEYLEYSLGDYTVIDTGPEHYPSRGSLVYGNCLFWELEYKNQNDEDMIFRFDNYFTLAEQVRDHAAEIGTNEVIKEIQNAFPSIDGWNAPIYHNHPSYGIGSLYKKILTEFANIRFEIRGRYEIYDQYDEEHMDAKTGIQISSVTARELVDDYHLTFGFQIDMVLNDPQSITTLQEKFIPFIPMFRYTAEYLNCDAVPFEFFVFEAVDDNLKKSILGGTYIRSTNTLEME